ncbi:sulfonate transport system substrate-binding protein [Isoptericola jiangsuensis]|uniref:Sulfonate transport system substrate-binding protein n=1 Tax=Isoptericola jiangsuensis TaxID=548579 RepID=A0A2A9ERP5_9MICO|nr:ABC transporter substrate-binding protein [Isoptericola jiangsuensis]PFG41548.1 sulfonate transport system substrate-binding protein [Isoptericola jiangsuensis]
MPRTRLSRPAPARPARTGRAAAAAVATSAAVLALAACGGDSAATDAAGDDVVLRVGELGTAITQETLLDSAGEGDDLGYEVEYSLFGNGPAFMEAVPSGAVDLTVMADTPSIFAQVGDIPVKVVAVQDTLAEGESFVEIVANPGSGIASVADLAGKKVAVQPATILQYTVVRALEAEGLSYDDITPVELPLPDAAAALAKGDVDAVASLDPTLQQLKANGAVTIGDGEGFTTGYSYVVATEAALADPAKADAIGDYLARLGRSYDWTVDHAADWAATTSQLTGLPEPVALAAQERRGSGWVPIDDDVVAKQQEQADVYTALGLIAEPLDVSTEYDDRYDDQLTGGDQ